MPEGVRVSGQPEGKHDFVHLFVTNSEQLGQLRQTRLKTTGFYGFPIRSAARRWRRI